MRKERVVAKEGLRELGINKLIEIDGGNSAQSENLFLKVKEIVFELFGLNKED